jgi:hypothetical protein
MSKDFIIADNSIKYANGTNPVNERMLYGGEGQWSRNMGLVKKYPDAESAIIDAKILQLENPVKIFMLETLPNGFNLVEVPF